MPNEHDYNGSNTVIAIDPGRSKCGLAILSDDSEILFRSVDSPDCIQHLLPDLIDRFHPSALIVGDGTGSQMMIIQCKLSSMGLPIHQVDERYTSELARQRYLSEHTPKGWRRLIPLPLRVPDAPYDDYVAVILAERWLRDKNGFATE